MIHKIPFDYTLFSGENYVDDFVAYVGLSDKVPGGQVSGIICIINMHLSHIFDKGELGSFDNRKLTTPLQSHCCFYMYKTAYS